MPTEPTKCIIQLSLEPGLDFYFLPGIPVAWSSVISLPVISFCMTSFDLGDGSVVVFDLMDYN